MRTYRKFIGAFTLAAALLAGSLAMAADKDKKVPDGTVTIDETQFAFIVGGSVGGGKLSFKGKDYDFKLGGLTVGANVGAAKISAAGEVFNLTDVAKFPGTYTKVDVSATMGGGEGILRLKNENGVILDLKSRNQGLQLNVGSASGVKIEMK